MLTSLFKLLIGFGVNGFLFISKDAEARIFICRRMPAYSRRIFCNFKMRLDQSIKHRSWSQVHHKQSLQPVPTRRMKVNTALPIKAPKTKSTHPITQASIAVSPVRIRITIIFHLSDYAFDNVVLFKPSALGIFVVMVLKILTRTRNIVMRSVILPGTTSGGMRKLIQETITNMPEGR